MTNAEAELHRLRQAVSDYLTEFYTDDLEGSRICWPSELEELVGWEEPQ